jgi:hypothetical protein
VLLDRVESDLVVAVLPALPAGEPLELVDRATRDTGAPWVQELERRGGELLRRSAASLPPAETEGVEPVGRLLARRRALVRRWQRTLAELGRELTVPERLSPEVDCSRELAHRVPRPELDEWEAIHRELRRPDRLAAFLRCGISTPGRAAARGGHRLDYARGLVPVPARLAAALGPTTPSTPRTQGLAARARQELRATWPDRGGAALAAARRSCRAASLRRASQARAYVPRASMFWRSPRSSGRRRGRGEQRALPEDTAPLFLAVLARDDAPSGRARAGAGAHLGSRCPWRTVTGDVHNRPWRR